jgi:RNA polymerase sigma-70 factor (ECF subfamily)
VPTLVVETRKWLGCGTKFSPDGEVMMAMMDDLVPEDAEDHMLGEVAEELFRRYDRPVRAYFLHKGFSAEESLDLAQETFYRVYKNKEGFRGESSVVTWLFQIASNLYKNTLRSQAAQKRDREEVSLESVEARLVEVQTGDDALQAMLMEERSKLLREALEELPPQMKKAVFLRVGGDLKYREIAEEMDVSIETVKAHLYQARQHLRERLSDYFTDEEL